MRSSHNTRQVFEDWLEMVTCSLSGGQMEDEYMALVPRYSEGKQGDRAIDFFPKALGALVEGMEKTRQDILGDLFQGGVTGGENGQFFTPDHLCRVMAQMTMPDKSGQRVLDPACGSGRTLLACADINRHNEFYGVDVDIRCVRMTAINLALRNLYGWVTWGDTLTNETWLHYRTGFNRRGVIEKVEPAAAPEPIKHVVKQAAEAQHEVKSGPTTQLSLF